MNNKNTIESDTKELALEKKVSELREQLSKTTDLLEEERKLKKLSKNFDFVQLQRDSIPKLIELAEDNHFAFKILMNFSQVMDKKNAIMISNSTMQSIFNVSRSTIARTIKYLSDKKWIQIVKVGTANAYAINASIFWTTNRNEKYSVFDAAVVTSMSEQNQGFRENSEVKLNRTPRLFKDEIPVEEIFQNWEEESFKYID